MAPRNQNTLDDSGTPDDSRPPAQQPIRSDSSLDHTKMSHDDGPRFAEASPLLRPAGASIDADHFSALSPQTTYEQDHKPDASQESKGMGYMLLLTLSMAGLQMAWSVEMAYGTPYLLSLGISKSVLGLVWIAGPLSGVLVQPYVGSKSDRCRSRYGKRRPFIVGGGLATILSLVSLAWAHEIVATTFAVFGGKNENTIRIIALCFAVLLIYILDFAINVIQAAVRAFIVDSAPAHQQSQANAWASRVSGFANIVGFMFGFVDLPHIFPWLGDTQFKVLCVIACIVLSTTVSISCLSIGERDPRLEGPPPAQTGGMFSFFIDMYKSISRLPPQIKKVCVTQFLAWIGWFPFLFYTTNFIGNIYVDPYLRREPDMTPGRRDELWLEGTRVATFALMIFACVTLFFSIVLPLVIQQTPRLALNRASTPMMSGSRGHDTTSNHHFPIGSKRPMWVRATAWVKHRIPSIHIPGLTLRRLFAISHVLFALIIWTASLAKTTRLASIMIACVGLPWAVTYWAPFALIAAEISKRDAARRQANHVPRSPTSISESHNDDAESGDQAGIVLGIHNVCIAAPQVIATLVSSVIYKLLQKPPGTPGDTSTAWVLRFGGLAALAAAILAVRIEEDTIGDEEQKIGRAGRV